MLIEHRIRFSVIGRPDQSLTFENREDVFSNAFSRRTLYQDSHLISGDLGSIALYRPEFEYLLILFRVARGRWATWLYRYWPDYLCTATPAADNRSGSTQGVLDLGSGRQYQIKKRYSGPGPSVDKIIYFPVESSIEIFINGISVLPSEWTYSGLGVIEFISDPPAGSVITINCEFDRPVRFDVDEINAVFLRDERAKSVLPGQESLSFDQLTRIDNLAIYSFDSLPVVEVFPPF